MVAKGPPQPPSLWEGTTPPPPARSRLLDIPGAEALSREPPDGKLGEEESSGETQGPLGAASSCVGWKQKMLIVLVPLISFLERLFALVSALTPQLLKRNDLSIDSIFL